MSDFSRRTLVRGVAWSVPVVAVAANAPAFATSHPVTPPGVNLQGSCANTGANNKGCGIVDKSLQIPVTVTNNTDSAIVFQVTELLVNNALTPPNAATDPGTYAGVSSIFATNATFTENFCQPVTESLCAGGANGDAAAIDSVVVAKNTTAYFFVVSNKTANSSDFSATITTRLLSGDGNCTQLTTPKRDKTTRAISNNNCE